MMDIQIKYFIFFISLVCLVCVDSDTAVTVVSIPDSVINNVNLRTDCHPDASMCLRRKRN
jgi:hypothetical protein